MRQISTKTDNSGDTWSAVPFNTWRDELEKVVTSAGYTLDPEAGPDTNIKMLVQSLGLYAGAGRTYFDSGTVNAYVLSLVGTFEPVISYASGLEAIFIVGTSNTGPSTINIETIGVKSLTLPGGTVLAGGEMIAGQYVKVVYNLANDRFELLGCVHLDNMIRTGTAGGTVDVITAIFTPIVAVLKNEIVLFIDMAGTNTSTTPTLKADGTVAKTIVKNGNQALVPGDIPGEAIYKFDTANDKWELLNPVGAPLGTSIATIIVQDDTQTTWAGSPNNQIPYDTTPPLVGEGREIFSQAYDEIASGNTLVIEVLAYIASANTNVHMTVALFDGSTLKAFFTHGVFDNAMRPFPVRFTVPTDGASHTWSVRIGHEAAAAALYWNFNGLPAGDMGGALMFSSIKITEYAGDILI